MCSLELPLHEGPPRIVLADVCVGLEALQEEDVLLGGPGAVCFAVRIVGMRGEAARSLAFKYFASKPSVWSVCLAL